MKIGDLYVPVQLDPLHCEHFEESGFGEFILLYIVAAVCSHYVNQSAGC